jgi:soluble lytic murein transglycosylase-like protein
MKDLSGTYVRRGDVIRRRRRIRAWFMLGGLVVAALAAARNWEPTVAAAAGTTGSEQVALGSHHAPAGIAGEQLERWHAIYNYSRRYQISEGLSTAIYDIARSEGIDPGLAFPLVRLESQFKERATSPVGAIGLAQVMLPTARGYVRDITREQLYDRDTNLMIGFRHLRGLLRQYRGNVQLALLVYNRGGVAVELDRELGIDPSNGYDRIVLKGYSGKGFID